MIPSALAPDASQRFSEMLPWYVNGTLDANDRHEMVRWLALSKDCRDELCEVIALARRIRNQPSHVHAPAGLSRLMTLVHRHDADKLLTLTPATQSAPPAAHRPLHWVSIVIAMAAVVVIVQAANVFMRV